jgi:integrase/recombinase XerD
MSGKIVRKRGKSHVRSRRVESSNNNSASTLQLTFAEGLELFVQAKKSEGVRQRTVNDYRQHIKYLTQFLDEFHPDLTVIQDLTPEIIRSYIVYLKDERTPYDGIKNRERKKKGLSASTINIRLRTLRTMCRFWYSEGYLSANPMEKIKLLKTDDDNLRGYTEKELKKLFGVIDTRQFSGYRDKVIMLLMLDTGMRINEVANVKTQNIDQKRMVITVPAEIAKNRKSRTIPISRKVMKMLLELHAENKQYFEESDYVFLTAYGEPIQPDTFGRRIYQYGKEAGLERATAHMFRHTFARDYLLNGGDLFTLQIILDHADISTTRRYIQMDDNHVKEQHLKFSPASKYL